MVEHETYGWLITVATADGNPSQVYNVAIREERLAVEAVKRLVSSEVLVTVRSPLSKQLFQALKMKAGDVMLGARKQQMKRRP
jgi:hypothetical protein